MDQNDQTHIELIELQKLVCADIAFFKKQQWQAAYYGVLVYAAIAAVPKVMHRAPSQLGFVVLGLVCFAVLLAGLYVLHELELALEKRRNLLTYARHSFTKKALSAYGA